MKTTTQITIAQTTGKPIKKTLTTPTQFAASDKDTFDRSLVHLMGYATLGQCYRDLRDIRYGEMRGDVLEHFMDKLMAMFAAALADAMPTADQINDDIIIAGEELALHEVRAARPPEPVKPAPKADDDGYVPYVAPAGNWRDNPAALTWRDIAHMETHGREEALKAIGMTDAGHETEGDIVESVNTWMMRTLRMTDNPIGAGKHLLGFMRLIFVQEMQKRDERDAKASAEAKPAKKSKAKRTNAGGTTRKPAK